LVPKLPDWMPWHAGWVYGSGLILILTGGAILTGYRQRLAGIVLAALILLSVLCLHIPAIATNPGAGFMWTNPCKALALFGGAILLASFPSSAVADRCAALLLGIFLLVCGVQHYVYLDFVIQLVPAWIPARPFWAYFTGTALIAGGAGVLLPRTIRLAGILAGIMIFLWVVLLHFPRAMTVPHDPGESSGLFEALALSGVCLLVAGTSRSAARN
jgi:uncharacterized membrane protein